MEYVGLPWGAYVPRWKVGYEAIFSSSVILGYGERHACRCTTIIRYSDRLWAELLAIVIDSSKRYPKDGLGMKTFVREFLGLRDTLFMATQVAAVIVGDTAHQAMIMHASYIYQINNFGDEIFINNIVTYVYSRFSSLYQLINLSPALS